MLYLPEGRITSQTDLGLFSYVAEPYFTKYVIFPHYVKVDSEQTDEKVTDPIFVID
jgi:hypothetical protein